MEETMPILQLEDVSIRYITGNFKDIGLKDYVIQKCKGTYEIREFWADRHITFALEKGDMLGIIGTNGAGKSTLLKVVSGIMEPTRGKVLRDGTIAPLLELASGFDGDLTVRENTFLRGAMLGYTRKFMNDTYDQISEFAELKDFEDRPFKQLSSGMKSRLAFAIASLVEPDILILDEVLSVGDGAFKKKSEAKMREIIHGGATTILVSHSLNEVRAMCNKVLWLHKGEQIAFTDRVEEVCDIYQDFLDGKFSLTSPETIRRQTEEVLELHTQLDICGSHVLAEALQGFNLQSVTTGLSPLVSELPEAPRSDWLVVDILDIIRPVYTVAGSGFFLAGPEAEGAEAIDPVQLELPALQETLSRLAERLSEAYGQDHLLLTDVHLVRYYLENRQLHRFPSFDRITEENKRISQCFTIMRRLLPEAIIIPVPKEMFAVADELGAFSPEHFHRFYYSYLRQAVACALAPAESTQARSDALGRLAAQYTSWLEQEKKLQCL